MSSVTILTPTLDRSMEVVARCIGSVDRQTLPSWQHWICSDGQREPAIELLCRADSRRSYMYLPKPAGHYGAGVRAALVPDVTTEYIAFLDDDNMLLPKFLERMVAALEQRPDAGFAICQIVHHGPLVKRFGLPPVIQTGVPPVVDNIDTLQVVVRTRAMQESGWRLLGYGSDGATYEDLAARYPWVAVDEVLALHL